MRDFDDIGRFIRLRSSIEGAMEAAPKAHAGVLLLKMYNKFSDQAFLMVPDEDQGFFREICPKVDEEQIEELSSRLSPTNDQQATAQGRLLLGSLAGFLDGYVQETKMRIEAEESARLAAAEGGQYL